MLNRESTLTHYIGYERLLPRGLFSLGLGITVSILPMLQQKNEPLLLLCWGRRYPSSIA